MSRRILYIILLVTLTVADVRAQTADTALKSTTIEVIQAYKPEVKEISKPFLQATLPPVDTAKPTLTYEVPQQTLYYTYSALPLRPLALGKDTTSLPFANYLQLGGGNLSTIAINAGATMVQPNKYAASMQLQHFSQHGQLKNQITSLSSVNAAADLQSVRYNWSFSLNGQRNQYGYYGYNHDLLNYGTDSLKQTFSGIEVTAAVESKEENNWSLHLKPVVSAYYYADRHQTSERSLSFFLPATRTIDSSFSVGLGVQGTFTSLVSTGVERGNHVFQITPSLRFRKGNFEVFAGVYPTLSSYYSLMLLPEIKANYHFRDLPVQITGGWTSAIWQNTFRQLTRSNPYLFPLNRYPGAFPNYQTKTDEVYAMISAGLGNHFSTSVKLGWHSYENLPMFMNDAGDQKNFYLLYDNQVNAVSFQVSARYQLAKKFSVGGGATFFNYYQKSFDRVWHRPGLRINGEMVYQPLKQLTITGYTIILDQIYALNAAQYAVKLEGAFDLGIGAEYSFIPRLSAFLRVNNLLNDRYQRWYGYESYGINLYGGLRLKF